MKQRLKSDSPPQAPAAYAAGVESRLSSDHVDRLLTEHGCQDQSPEAPGAAPIDGIWLGAALGIVLWAVIGGVVLLS